MVCKNCKKIIGVADIKTMVDRAGYACKHCGTYIHSPLDYSSYAHDLWYNINKSQGDASNRGTPMR